MPTLIFRRLCGMAAVPVLMLGLSACTIHSQADPDEVAVSLPGAHEAVIAAYDGLADEPFTIKTSLEVNELDFIDQSTMVDGDSRRTTQDTYMSVIHEISGSDYSDDPEMAELMKSQFADLQMEAIVVDEIAYMYHANDGYDSLAEEFGEDAWFSVDVTAETELGEIYGLFNTFDSADLAGQIIGDLADVELVGDGAYTGRLHNDTEALRSLLEVADASTANDLSRVDEIEVNVALDDGDELESIELTLPETVGMTTTFVSEVVESGGEYEITAPATDNLYPIEELNSD